MTLLIASYPCSVDRQAVDQNAMRCAGRRAVGVVSRALVRVMGNKSSSPFLTTNVFVYSCSPLENTREKPVPSWSLALIRWRRTERRHRPSGLRKLWSFPGKRGEREREWECGERGTIHFMLQAHSTACSTTFPSYSQTRDRERDRSAGTPGCRDTYVVDRTFSVRHSFYCRS